MRIPLASLNCSFEEIQRETDWQKFEENRLEMRWVVMVIVVIDQTHNYVVTLRGHLPFDLC